MTNESPHHRTIRIRLETYRRLKVLAARLGISMVALLERWVSDEERKHTSSDTKSSGAQE